MKFILRLKSNNERVYATDAHTLEEAKRYFINTKRMDMKTFDGMFIVTEETIDEVLKDTKSYRNTVEYRAKFNERRSRQFKLKKKTK